MPIEKTTPAAWRNCAPGRESAALKLVETADTARRGAAGDPLPADLRPGARYPGAAEARDALSREINGGRPDPGGWISIPDWWNAKRPWERSLDLRAAAARARGYR